MQMLLGQTGGATGPSKNEIDEGASASPWANLLSVGLRVLTALLGGPQQPVDGIDKVDNQSSPMQVGENKRGILVCADVSTYRRETDKRCTWSLLCSFCVDCIHVVVSGPVYWHVAYT